MSQGILKTTSRRRNSAQSTSGFVYLSLYPDSARTFGELAYPRQDVLVYSVDIKIKEVGLRPGEKLYEELLNDKEKTSATMNKKIMVAKVRTYNYRDVCDHIEQIIDWANKGNVHNMVFAMKRFVPEYKSNQSAEFEAIDHELEAEAPQQAQTTPERYY